MSSTQQRPEDLAVLLAEIAATSRRLADTSSRLGKIDLLAECLRRLGPDEVEIGVAFLSGETRQGRLGVGPAGLAEARPGTAAGRPELTLGEVDAALDDIEAARGPGSARERVRSLGGLLARATGAEQDFLGRLLLGELRQGALGGLLVEAVALAGGVAADDVRRSLTYAGELAPVARAVLREGKAGLSRFAVRLFRPVRPMLALPSDDLASALTRLGDAALEWKLDGARIQVHLAGRDVRVFTRRLNDVTAAVPELAETARALPAAEAILDGEALALRPDGSPRPFQTTMRRFGRRLEVERLRRELPLTPFFFDCLYLDGEPLADRPASERARALGSAVPAEIAVPRLDTPSQGDAEAFLAGALRRGHEGVVAKALGAPYEAGRRGPGWLKVKPAHTLELVVLAAEWGHGRRRGWLSNLHLGARDPTTGGYVMLGKTFKGLTDETLAWQTRRLQGFEIARDRWTVHVRPELVVEVAFDGVQTSPRYPGGMALRFARVRRYRPDKTADTADTVEAVRAVLTRQGAGRA